MDDRRVGRAAFLGTLGLGVAGLFFGRDAVQALGRILPDGVSAVVPTSGWRIYTIGAGMPDIAPAGYRLQVVGEVERPRTYTLADLRRLPRTEQVSDFHCVTGWSVEDVHWGGVRLADLLADVRLRPLGRFLRFVSDEVPYDDWLTLEQALLPDVLLATEMDGRALPRPHGAPVRLVVPRMYGYKSVKWVTGIEVRTDVIPGYWEQHGYDADAWVGGSNGLSA
jgi:DMSO/TMAO reductase YedYZ molybdopterin-dependent catalytic subunit